VARFKKKGSPAAILPPGFGVLSLDTDFQQFADWILGALVIGWVKEMLIFGGEFQNGTFDLKLAL